MQTRSVAAGRGWQWLVEGFRIFRKQPLTWIALLVVMLVIWFASLLLPLFGPLAISLVSPVFLAGLMLACRTTDEDGEPEMRQLFAAFKTHASPLVTVGGIYLVGNIVAVGIVFGVAGGTALPTLMAKSGGDIEAISAALRGLLLGLTVGMVVFMPVLMAAWFAPLLIVFNNTPPIEAMKLSYTACWRNMMPFLVYGMAILVLWIIASIPLMLGLIVLLPVLVCSIYASYKDIFPADAAASPPDRPLQ
ncbi:MAG: BPSS1780 family membrane protein [Burkholderiales bacterium]|nr:BPSS1780 family membrane protein [Burkholderiales bacterium]